MVSQADQIVHLVHLLDEVPVHVLQLLQQCRLVVLLLLKGEHERVLLGVAVLWQVWIGSHNFEWLRLLLFINLYCRTIFVVIGLSPTSQTSVYGLVLILVLLNHLHEVYVLVTHADAQFVLRLAEDLALTDRNMDWFRP